jgi:hypothetical protein
MHTVESIPAKVQQLPRWLIGVAVLVAGTVTAGAMWMTRFKGPQMAWDAAHAAVEGAWGEPWEHAASPNLPADPGWAGNPVQTVAGVPGVPVIVAGAPIPHVDRGACTTCHSVMSSLGRPIVSIRSYAAMPHEYRGVCVNCHQVTLAATGNMVAGSPPPSQPLAAPPPAAPPQTPPRQPSEAEWQGLEVGPGTYGVVVNGAEAAAGRRGLATGDLVVSINGAPIRTMLDFSEVTQKGKLAQGTVIVDRKGQRLAFDLGQPPTPPPAAPAPQAAWPSPIGQPVAPQPAQWPPQPAAPQPAGPVAWPSPAAQAWPTPEVRF